MSCGISYWQFGFCETKWDIEHSLIRLNIITSTRKYENEYYKTRIGKIYNAKSRKKGMIQFPNSEKNLFLILVFLSFITCGMIFLILYFTTCGFAILVSLTFFPFVVIIIWPN